MVDDLQNIKTFFQSEIKGLIENAIRQAFIEQDSVLEDMNIEQLKDGKRSDGSSLPDYSPISVEVYGKPQGAIKLLDTGDFHKGITLEAGQDEAELVGKDSKTTKLMFEYDESIIGVSIQNLDKFTEDYIKEYIFEALQSKVK